ncbi:hypothetical protein EON67_03310 [archaeon]|nr:MAG: hypothetical protein EON67_03310 [archaeon]
MQRTQNVGTSARGGGGNCQPRGRTPYSLVGAGVHSGCGNRVYARARVLFPRPPSSTPRAHPRRPSLSPPQSLVSVRAAAVSMDAFVGACDAVAYAIIKASNAALPYDLVGTGVHGDAPLLLKDARPVAAWPLMRLHEAVLVLAAYCVWIAFGLAKKRCERAGATAPTTAAAGKRPDVTCTHVLRQPGKHILPLFKDPIKLAQTLYNVVQVRSARACVCGVRVATSPARSPVLEYVVLRPGACTRSCTPCTCKARGCRWD